MILTFNGEPSNYMEQSPSEKLMVAELVKKFTFYGAQKFITVFTGSHQKPRVTFHTKLLSMARSC